MTTTNDITQSWATLPAGARIALEEQWVGVAASALPCGASIVDEDGMVIARGRNHAYDPPVGIETRVRYALQHTRLAHAELNALAQIPTETNHAKLTLWTTQHPCSMCAAALAFTGVGQVRFVADDPSDDSSPEAILASRGRVAYESLGDPLWWTISNLLFLYNSAVQAGESAGNLKMNQDRYPELVRLTLELAREDVLGIAARSGTSLSVALRPYSSTIKKIVKFAPQ